MSFKAIIYAYVLGGLTFIPLVVIGLIFFTIYTSVPVGDPDVSKNVRVKLEGKGQPEEPQDLTPTLEVNDLPGTRKGWLTMRRTFEESALDGGYVTLVRSFLDARSKDPKRSRPKDTWYVVLKGTVLYLYEDESMTECEAAIELGGHDVVVYPEGLLDGELFAKRNAICLKPKIPPVDKGMPSITREMKLESNDIEQKAEEAAMSARKKEKLKEKLAEAERARDTARDEALNQTTPWFIFVRNNVEMEDWYFSFIHASDHSANSPMLTPLEAIFRAMDMNHLVTTLDEQPDVIPMRWFNALIGRLFFSYYRTRALEAYIIGRLMKKLSKVKRPNFLTDIVVTEVSVGNTAPTLSKPMLKELTKEGDAALEVRLQYKGEVRITVEATATINLGARFKSYTVKLTLAAVLRELEGNLLIKVKRPPSNRIWYAFTQTPRMVLDVEPVVSDRQITWSMILNTIESRLKEIIQESVVMPNMDDIAFFESSQYMHRGGIWSDACRRERTPSAGSDQTTEEKENASSSVPNLETATAVPEMDPAEVQPQFQSAEELFKPSSSTPPESTVIAGSATESDATESSPTTTRARRRTWFSSISTAPSNGTSSWDEGSFTGSSLDAEESRGRTADIDTTLAPRSRSTPNDSTTRSVDAEDNAEFLAPESAEKKHSRQSSTSSSPSSHPVEDNIFNDLDSTTPQKPKSVFRQPTSPSFLSTLKSRAGDKQAISNTAKEAMRKWGVNWGGLRRDGSGGSAGSTNSHEDIPDVGPADSKQDPQKTRPNYADVRAAVAERKEREKAMHGEQVGLGLPSEPISIPDSHRTSERSVSAGSSFGLSASSSSGKGHHDAGEGSTPPRFVTPSVSRPTTELNTSTYNGSIKDSRIAPIILEPEVPPSLIHTQPSQARSMVIPGIHASHRGEVMSMGYVVPPPPPAPSEGKIKAPAIQSVYRLWKSPTLSGQQQQQQQSDSESQIQTEQDTGERNKDVTPLSLSPSPSPAPSRPVPPPLPPRSRTDIPKVVAENSLSVSSPASEALKTIATKDKRLSQELPSLARRISGRNEADDSDQGTASPTKPPLPPRRIPTIA